MRPFNRHAYSAGQLRTRLTVQRDGTSRSASGAKTRPWQVPVDVVDLWACLEPMEAGKSVFGNPEWRNSLSMYRITIHWRDDVTPAMRMRLTNVRDSTSRYFYIQEVPVATREQRFISLLCQEVI